MPFFWAGELWVGVSEVGVDLISLKCHRMVVVGGRSFLNSSRAFLVSSSD